MADEISLSVRMKVRNGLHRLDFLPLTKLITQANEGANSGIVTVGFAAEEDLVLSDIATEGLFALLNLDDTNFVTWGPKDTVMKDLGRLNPGEPNILRLSPGVVVRWQADTADVNVHWVLLEN